MASIDCSSSGSICPGIVAALQQRQFEEVWAHDLSSSTTQDSVLRLTPEFDFDDFHVGAILGQGSFSTVQRVSLKSQQHETNEYECMYALKRLKPNVVADSTSCAIASADLAVETRILTMLKHENIIALHGVKSGDMMESLKNGTYFIVLDLLHTTLEARMLKWRQEQSRSLFNSSNRKQISEKLKHAAMGIANGMAYLHSKRIILRDLKPANVGFDYDNDRVKIFDFGLARACISRDTQHVRETPLQLMTICVGTPRYMAPEVHCEGRAYGYPVDVYSFGILLWEIVTNRRAFSKLSSLKDFTDKVSKGNKRPNLKCIESNILKELLESSWSSDPAIRPSFEFIGQALKNIAVRYEFDLIEKRAKTRVRSKSDISRSLLDRTHSTSSMFDDDERLCKSVGHSSSSSWSRGSLSMPPFFWNRSSYAAGWSGDAMRKSKTATT